MVKQNECKFFRLDFTCVCRWKAKRSGLKTSSEFNRTGLRCQNFLNISRKKKKKTLYCSLFGFTEGTTINMWHHKMKCREFPVYMKPKLVNYRLTRLDNYNLSNSHRFCVHVACTVTSSHVYDVIWCYVSFNSRHRFTLRNEAELKISNYSETGEGRRSVLWRVGTSPFIGIAVSSLTCCWVTLTWKREVIYTVGEKCPQRAVLLTECLSEEETSAAAARKPSTSLRRCSVRAKAGINPVFCAVSIKVLR